MLPPKPLTKERRQFIKTSTFDIHTLEIIRDIMAAEQYWREAVRDADFHFVGTLCPWCQVMICDDGWTHRENCEYLLAQDVDES